jgi:putative ABC transport system ATP-binding protein
VRFVDGKVDSDGPNPHPVGLRAHATALSAVPAQEVS